MSRHYDRPIECESDRAGRPVRFRWRGTWYRVARLLDTWIEVGEWWNGEPETTWYRVETTDRGVFELYTPTDAVAWRLWKVID